MQEQGFSLVEMIATLLIMGIVSVVVISRVASVYDMELAAQVNSVRNHIRYAQIMSMKRNDKTWGIKCDGNDYYWVFKTATPSIASETDDSNNMVILPGNEDKKIAMPLMDAFTLYFDKFGIPYVYNTGIGDIEPATSQTISIGDKALTVIAETGFVE